MDGNKMEIGWIAREELPPFRSMLLPGAAAELEQGRPLTALGVSREGTACGATAAWLREDGTLEIQSLYVAPDYRRQGAGRLLVDTLCQTARGRCQAISLSYTHTHPDHDTLPPFLAAMGFAPEKEEGNVYRITLEALARTPFLTAGGAAPGLHPFEQVPKGYLTMAYKKALLAGEDYLDTRLDDLSVDQRVSVAVIEGGSVRSFAAFTAAPGQVTLAWLRSGCAQDVPLLLRGAFARLRQHYPPDTVLTIQAAHPAASALVTTLIPQAQPISHTYVRGMEGE